MANSEKSGFRRHGSLQRTSSITPLRVHKGFRKRWDDISEQVIDTDVATTSEGDGRRPRRLTSKSERLIATRMNELSQLESPLLRELAQRLSVMLQIEKPLCFEKFDHPYTNLDVGDRWEEIQGCNDWNGLLQPDFNPVLKGEILRYGEFAQATYDAFDRDKRSKHYGTCKYTKSNLLEQVGLENRGYEITNFLYATTNLQYPNFLAWYRDIDGAGNSQKVDENGKESKYDVAHHGDDSHSLTNTHSEQDSSEQGRETIQNWKCKHCSKNSKQCNWIGFVAVCTSPEEIARQGRRDILIAWRGSVTRFDWIADLMDFLSPAAFGPDHVSSKVRVEKGFLYLYTSKNVNSRYNHRKSARDQVGDAVKHLVGKYRHEGKLSITVTGHSLGSALATLCAYDIAVCQFNLLSGTPNVSDEWHSPESGHEVAYHGDHGRSRHPHLSALKDALHISVSHASEKIKNHHDLITKPLEKVIFCEDQIVNKFPRDRVPVTVYSFGGPKVGNKYFVRSMEALGVAVLRVVNIHDKVTKVPGRLIHRLPKKLEEVFTDMLTYKHVGVKLKVDNEKSEYLQKPAGLVRPHNLEGYLHLVDSYHGPGKPYAKTSRDFALVNKSSDYLHRKFAIPSFWLQEKNKGLVRDQNSEWRYPDRDETVPMTPPTSVEEEEWKRTVKTAEAKSKIAMLHNSSEPSSSNGDHICE